MDQITGSYLEADCLQPKTWMFSSRTLGELGGAWRESWEGVWSASRTETKRAHPMCWRLLCSKPFLFLYARSRSSPRSYGHLRIPPDASSTHSCPSHFRLFPIAFPFGPRPSPHMKQNVQRCVFLQKMLRRRDSSTYVTRAIVACYG